MIKTARASECRDLPDGEAADIREPIEEVAVTVRYKGLGDFLQRDKDEEDKGDCCDATRQMTNLEI